ncbi:MAG: cold shock domain-containing protein [Deltaproteobacteria bacterium]|nr:cold shock domain-containing protein [Deltaproteobacteria bacterium]
MKGTVKKLIRDRGFGFITAEDGNEVFFHRSDLVEADFDAMEEGASVEFEMGTGAKGPRAMKVTVV